MTLAAPGGRPATRRLFAYAQILLFFHRHARAHEVLLQLLEHDPDHKRALAISGFLYSEKGQFAEAVRHFERALALAPADAPLFFNAAFALQRAGRHEEAIRRFQQAIDLDPILDRAWYGMGLSLAHLGRHEEAVGRFKEAARQQPLNPYAGYQLAGALFKLGRQEEVRAEYLRVKQFDPKISDQIRRDFGVDP
jgi:tetratricopeptide (TPR) repeat protein